MNFERYDFAAKKCFHEALRLARSLNHPTTEVEHLALALLRDPDTLINGSFKATLIPLVEGELKTWPRMFGLHRLGFGPRLNTLCQKIEQRGPQIISSGVLWQRIIVESTVVKLAIAKSLPAEQSSPPDHDPPSPSSHQAKKARDQPQNFKPKKPSSRPLSDQFTPLNTSLSSPEGKANDKQPLSDSNQTAPPNSKSTPLSKEHAALLDRFTIDLTSRAQRRELDPIFGRELEVRRVLEVLGRKKKNNPLLLGEPGVGKTAIVELLAQKIAEGNAPESMLGMRVLALDLGSVIAGAKYRGEFEERLKLLIQAFSSLKDQVIIFIDEIHMLIGAGNIEGGADAANLLKPALARGEFRCIGATTEQEYKKFFRKDLALERRFQSIQINEPTKEETIALLRSLKGQYETFHRLKITDAAIVTAVECAQRYLPRRKFPDKAFDVLDESCSRVRLTLDTMPRELEVLKSRLESLNIELESLKLSSANESARIRLEVMIDNLGKEFQRLSGVRQSFSDHLTNIAKIESQLMNLESMGRELRHEGEFNLLAQLDHEKVPQLKAELARLHSELLELKNRYSFLSQDVDAQTVAHVIADWTGIPVSQMDQEQKKSLSSLASILKAEVFGQDHALEIVAKTVQRSRLGLNEIQRPLGVFLFLGPSGVGKTLCAKVLARQIFGNEKHLVRFDMGEFTEPHSVARLIGSPPGYVGSAEGGELTEAIKVRPYAVILLDEIEKAHPKIFDLMLTIFDEGQVKDAKGELVNLRNTLLVMTSNLNVWNRAKVNDFDRDSAVRTSLFQHFRPEFVNRIDEVVVFQPLQKSHYERVLETQVIALNAKLADRFLRLTLAPNLVQNLIEKAATSPFGGRYLKTLFKHIVLDAVSERLLSLAQTEAQGAYILDFDQASGQAVWSKDQDERKLLPPGLVRA